MVEELCQKFVKIRRVSESDGNCVDFLKRMW